LKTKEDKRMKEKLWTVIGGIGMITLLAGASAMDSEVILLPVLMVVVGLGLCVAAARNLELDEKI